MEQEERGLARNGDDGMSSLPIAGPISPRFANGPILPPDTTRTAEQPFPGRGAGAGGEVGRAGSRALPRGIGPEGRGSGRSNPSAAGGRGATGAAGGDVEPQAQVGGAPGGAAGERPASVEEEGGILPPQVLAPAEVALEGPPGGNKASGAAAGAEYNAEAPAAGAAAGAAGVAPAEPARERAHRTEDDGFTSIFSKVTLSYHASLKRVEVGDPRYPLNSEGLPTLEEKSLRFLLSARARPSPHLSARLHVPREISIHFFVPYARSAGAISSHLRECASALHDPEPRCGMEQGGEHGWCVRERHRH